jgi:3-phosphoshikimate 1-carboxyvinyltransferase
MAVELSRLGARVEEKDDGLIIHGGAPLHGGAVSSWNDHRIAMDLASIFPAINGRLTIDGADSVRKS